MARDLSAEFPDVSYFWESGKYVLHHWRQQADDILLDCMIYDICQGSVIRIEDNELSYALKKKMQEAGVPVVTELPEGSGSILEVAIRELMDLGMGFEDFAKAHEELKAMHEAGISRVDIQKRLAEMKADHKKIPPQKQQSPKDAESSWLVDFYKKKP